MRVFPLALLFSFNFIRLAISIFCGYFAVIFLIAILTMPREIRSDISENLAYLNDFKAAEKYTAAYLAREGRLPSSEELKPLGNTRFWNRVELHESSMPVPASCEPETRGPFKLQSHDRFILSFWTGDFSECFASPSGTTTLETDYRRSLIDRVPRLILHSAFVMCFGLLCWFSWPRRWRTKEAVEAHR